MRGYSPILVSAALSVAVLISAVGMQLGTLFASHAPSAPIDRAPIEAPRFVPIDDSDNNGTPDWQDELLRAGVALATSSSFAASTTDPLSLVAANVAQSLYSGYVLLKQHGQYTPERGEQLAQSVASSIKAPVEYTPYTVDALTIDTSNSKDVLDYRADMRIALEPLITDELPEIEYLARYMTTKDRSWIEKLKSAALRYHTAEINVRAVPIPKEAAPEHLRVLNSLGTYAHVLDQASSPFDDAFAYTALVKSLNDAEQELFNAFNSLAQYYVRTVATQ